MARAVAYVAAGADMLFVEAAQTLDDYRAFKDACPQRRFWPTLPNLARHRFLPPMRLPPPVWILCSSRCRFRAMNQAALSVYRTIRKDRSQNAVLQTMQNTWALYDYLDYHAQEEKMNK